jgi:hypothetical protein
MSTEIHRGDFHTFTSKSNGSIITLQAGKNETLNLIGTINGTTGGTADLTTVLSTTELGYYELTSTQTIQHSDTTNLKNQGLKPMGVSDNGYIVFTGYNQSPTPDVGGGAVFFNNGTNTFTQQATLSTGIASSIVKIGVCIDINEDGTFVVMASSENGGINKYELYTRSGTSWTKNATTSSSSDSGPPVNNCSISGSSALITAGNGLVLVVKNTAGTWAIEQTVRAEDATGQGIIGDISGNVLAFNVYGGVQVWTRSGSTWTLLQTLTGIVSDSNYAATSQQFIKVRCEDPSGAPDGDCSVFIASSNNVYVYERLNGDTTFNLSTTFANINSVGIADISSTKFISFTATTIHTYLKYEDAGWVEIANSLVLSGVTQVAGGTGWIAMGIGAGDSGNGQVKTYLVDDFSPEADITVVDINIDNDIELDTVFPVRIDSGLTGNTNAALVVTGDASISGTIFGKISSNYAELIKTNTQNILNDTETVLTGYLDTSVFNSVYLSAISSSGRIYASQIGFYMVCGCTGFAGNAVGYRSAQILVNGSPTGCIEKRGSSTDEQLYSISTIVRLNVGSYVELSVKQTSTGTLATSVTGSSTYLKVIFLSI